MAATKKTGTTKKTNKKASARVLSEKELQTLIDAVPDERRKVAANIVSELVWMSKMMDTLKSKADEIGPLEWFVQGEQSMLRENPALKSYNTTIKNYATLLSKLTDLLPKATTPPPTSDAGDQFDDFVAGRDAD